MILITHLVPLLACVCLGMSAAITFDRPFGYTLAPTFIVTCLLIYVSQLVFGSKDFFTHGSEGYELVKRFATALVTMSLIRLPVRIHYVSFLLLAVIAIYCLHLQYRQHLTTGQAWLWSLIVFGGGLAYAVVLFILYCFCFESAEVKSLASLNRYLSSYTTMVALWLLGSWWYWHSQCGHQHL